jgi:hypothetical protein
MDKARLIKMGRIEPIHPGGPTTADVHVDEMMSWMKAGWQVLEGVGEPNPGDPEPNTTATSDGQAAGAVPAGGERAEAGVEAPTPGASANRDHPTAAQNAPSHDDAGQAEGTADAEDSGAEASAPATVGKKGKK